MTAGKKLQQWHDTELSLEGENLVFTKHYQPESYEIRNEVSWLTLTLLQSRGNFQVPSIRDISFKEGYVKMDGISEEDDNDKKKTFDHLVDCAAELHGLIESNNPHMRTKVSESEYIPYLKSYTRERTDITAGSSNLEPEIISWIEKNVDTLSYGKFSIVHRDLRHRHLLLGYDDIPTLIDWEFSNISEPAQDLAKMIFDGVVNHGFDYRTLFERVVERYSYTRKIAPELLRSRILVFLPIIPLEHTTSFILRKPEGFMGEVEKDLSFINEVYNEEK